MGAGHVVVRPEGAVPEAQNPTPSGRFFDEVEGIGVAAHRHVRERGAGGFDLRGVHTKGDAQDLGQVGALYRVGGSEAPVAVTGDDAPAGKVRDLREERMVLENVAKSGPGRGLSHAQYAIPAGAV